MLSFTGYASGIRHPDYFNLAVNWKSNNDVTISDMKSSPNLFNFVSFLLSSLVANPSFMSMPSLVLELRQFLFVRDSPEIRKSEEPPSEFCPISGAWGEWRIPNLAWAPFIKCYWTLQNGRVVAFTVSELLRANQQRGKITPHPPRLRLTDIQRSMSMLLDTRSHIWLIMTLYYKMRQVLLQNATAILLQNATEVYITKCDSYYKLRQYTEDVDTSSEV